VLLVRPGLLVAAAPAFGGTYAPGLLKVGLTVVLALVVATGRAGPQVLGPVGIGVVVAREAAIAVAGLRREAPDRGAELAGYLAGFQIGFTYATVADPQTGAHNNVLSTVYGPARARGVLRGQRPPRLHPRAAAVLRRAAPRRRRDRRLARRARLARMLGAVFTIGAQMAAPVVIVLLGRGARARADVAGRAVTEHPVRQGFPVRWVSGCSPLAATLRAIPVVIESANPATAGARVHTAAVFR